MWVECVHSKIKFSVTPHLRMLASVIRSAAFSVRDSMADQYLPGGWLATELLRIGAVGKAAIGQLSTFCTKAQTDQIL